MRSSILLASKQKAKKHKWRIHFTNFHRAKVQAIDNIMYCVFFSLRPDM